MNEKQEEQLYIWIEKQIDGRLSEEESNALEDLILNNKEARSIYVDITTQNAYIYEQGLTQKHKSAVQSSNSFYKLALAVAALLVIGLIIFNEQPQSDNHIAKLTKTENCSWKGSTLPTTTGSKLIAGNLHLDKGLATIEFNSGATVVIQAPAKLQLIDEMNCLVHYGTVVADVPEQAHGFTIDTPKAKAIDHGTKFIVSYNDKTEKSFVEVLEGEVEVKSNLADESKRFFAGKVAVVKGDKVDSHDITSEREIDHNLQISTDKVVIRTSDGRGMDQAIDFSKTTKNKNKIFLTVKKSIAELKRKSYIKFDLASIKGRKIKDVKRKLRMVPTEWGEVALIPNDVKFTIYGLTDETLDNWNENKIKWENAPANIQKGYSLRQSKVIKVAEFGFERSVIDKLITVNGAELQKFLEADTNELATFIIVRESSEYNKSGYVHGFASKEHPINFPPTLEFELE